MSREDAAAWGDFCTAVRGIVWFCRGDSRIARGGAISKNAETVFLCCRTGIDAGAEAFSYATAQRWLPPALSGYLVGVKNIKTYL